MFSNVSTESFISSSLIPARSSSSTPISYKHSPLPSFNRHRSCVVSCRRFVAMVSQVAFIFHAAVVALWLQFQIERVVGDAPPRRETSARSPASLRAFLLLRRRRFVVRLSFVGPPSFSFSFSFSLSLARAKAFLVLIYLPFSLLLPFLPSLLFTDSLEKMKIFLSFVEKNISKTLLLREKERSFLKSLWTKRPQSSFLRVFKARKFLFHFSRASLSSSQFTRKKNLERFRRFDKKLIIKT